MNEEKPLDVGIFGHWDTNKREWFTKFCDKIALMQDFLKTQSFYTTIGTWNDEYLINLPAEKPVLLLKNDSLRITEYPHAYFPHPYLECDILIILLNSSMNCRNLKFFANELSSSAQVYFLKNPFNWQDEVCIELVERFSNF